MLAQLSVNQVVAFVFIVLVNVPLHYESIQKAELKGRRQATGARLRPESSLTRRRMATNAEGEIGASVIHWSKRGSLGEANGTRDWKPRGRG